MKKALLLASLLGLGGLTACSTASTTTSDTSGSTTAVQVMYWEVAPELVSCSHPLIPNYQCMHVRQVEYSPSAQVAPAGEWSYYYGNIDGYEHQKGQGAVLKIKRTQREHVPADASQYQDELLEVLSQKPGHALP